MTSVTSFLLQFSWLIPCYGFLGAILALPWCTGFIRRSGPRPAAYLNLLMTLLAFIHGGIAFQATLEQGPHLFQIHWLAIDNLDLTLTFNFSAVSLGATELISGLSFLTQLYALGYLEKDWALARFFVLLGFFEGAISGLALSDSLLLTYGLLEMLTLSSYLLVGFWYAQPLVVTAARDAFLTKRVGDILLLMGVVTVGTLAGSFDFVALYDWAGHANLSPTLATLIGLALIAGPTGKCAQFPLHLWLDEAMEAPSPASILRNSVVVSAGAYVLIKLQPILSISPIALDTLVILGTITAIGSSLMAIAQIDIKRTLSHSTSAYLGLVFIAVGLQWTDAALLILLAHGIAKALLFMSIGSVILATNNQDLIELGGMGSRMPATTTAFIVGSAGLIGFLPLGGFWALVRGLYVFRDDQPWIFILLLVVNSLSALNLCRVFRHVFLGQAQAKTRWTPEAPWPMAVPTVILTVITLLTPLILQKLSLIPSFAFVNHTMVILLVLSGVVGIAVGFSIPLDKTWSRPMQKYHRFLQDFLAYDFYVDRLYRFTVVLGVSLLSKAGAWLDRYIVDGVVNLVGLASIFSGEGLRYSISGQTQTYVLTIVVGMTLLLGFLISSSL